MERDRDETLRRASAGGGGMSAHAECKCHCGKSFTARVADVKRGWAKSCSKRCAAIARERKLDRFGYRGGARKSFGVAAINGEEAGFEAIESCWDGHKEVF